MANRIWIGVIHVLANIDFLCTTKHQNIATFLQGECFCVWLLYFKMRASFGRAMLAEGLWPHVQMIERFFLDRRNDKGT